MNNTSSIAQFLTVLGGSTNPALLQNTGQKTDGSTVDFRALFAMQFGGVAPLSPEGENGQSNALTTLQNSLTNAAPSQNANIWQLVNQNVAGQDVQNAIVLQLKQQGIAPEAIEQLVAAVDQSDLITIIKDPKLSAQLQNIVAGVSATNDNEIQLPKLADIIEAIKDAKGIQDENGQFITVDVAEMSLEEFKEWKKDNFSDLAAFFNTPKTKVGANGEILKILEGPAFLHDDASGPSDLVVVDIVQPQAPLTPVEFALQIASTIAPAQQSTAATAPNSFLPVPLNNLGQLSAELKTALQGTPNEKKGDVTVSPTVAGITKPTTGTPSPFAQAIATSSTPAQGNNSTILTPFTTPADFHAFNGGGEGLDNFEAFLPVEAGFKTASHSANPLLGQPSASQPHQTTQMVAISLTKMANGKGAETNTQKYRLQLDPPEMGRVDIELDFDPGHKVRAMIVVEKPETLNLLQRDSHALLKALQDAGFEGASQGDLNFNLSQGQNDPAGHGGSNADDRQNGQNALLSSNGESELQITETEMNLVIDPITGQQRLNMVV